VKPTAALANSAWLASSLPAWHRFRRALPWPQRTQAQLLQRLLTTNAACAYGRQFGIGTIGNYAQFRERVPLVSYDDLEPWISRIKQGEPSVLTEAPVTRLVPTSGSSGARKLIPFTAALQQEFNAAIGPWMVDLTRHHPGIPWGPAYWSISPAIPTSKETSAVPVGFDDDSAYLGGLRARLAEATFAVPSSLRLVSDLDTSRYLTLLHLLRERDLRLISVWHPSFLTLLLDGLSHRWDEVLADIQHGGRQQPPRPARAEELRRLGPENAAALWPHLQTISCWGDGHAALALAGLKERFPGVPVQPKGLLATEAFVSIPFRGHHPLALNSHFFEFINPGGSVLLAHQLRLGETYEIVVTTGGGLWRYRLGDLVEVDTWIGATPSLRFLGRGDSVSDLCGEKLHESFVTQVLAEVFSLARFTPNFAMLAPELNAYTLFIEGAIPQGLAGQLDTALQENPHYCLCRSLGQLGPVKCFSITSGAYETFTTAGLARGQRLGDIKPRALSPRTDWRPVFDKN
jgi:hypothetical protein